MAGGLDLHILDRSQLRNALSDAFQKLTFVRQTIENIPIAHVPFPRLQEVSFFEQRLAEYQSELARRRTLNTPVRIFFSYSQEDAPFLVELKGHLQKQKGEEPIEIFWDRTLPAGVEWYPETMAELKESDVVLLLVSPEFLASRYCQDIELPAALDLHDCGLTAVVPVIIRSCRWQETTLARLQAVSAGGIPIFEAPDRADALAEAVQAIFRIVGLIRVGHNPRRL
jgi:hypothetical protein